MYKKITILICALLAGHITIAQELSAEDILKNVETYYKNVEVLDVEMEYKMFRGYTGNNLTESYKGTIYMNGKISRIEILGSEIVQLPKAKIIINNDKKTVTYNELKNDAIQNSPLDMSTFFKFYKTSSIKYKGNLIIQEMIQKELKIALPYNKIVLYIDKTSYQVKKQELYFSTKMPFVDKNGKSLPDQARMEISFSPNPQPLKIVPKLSNYVHINSDKAVTLSKNYASYSIVN